MELSGHPPRDDAPPVGISSWWWGLFLLFPLLLTWAGHRLLFADATERDLRQAEERLTTAFSQIEADKTPLLFFTREFRLVEEEVFRVPPKTPSGGPDPRFGTPTRRWARIRPGLEKRFPGTFQVVFLDGNGIPIKGFMERPAPRFLTQKFFAASVARQRERKPLSGVEVSFIKTFLGPGVSPDVNFFQRLMLGSPRPKECFVYLSRPRKEGMFILFFHPARHLQDLAVLEQAARLCRKGSGLKLTIAFCGDSCREVLGRLGVKTRVPTSFWRKLQRSESGTARFGPFLVGRRILFPSAWAVGVTPSGTRGGSRSRLPVGPFFLLGLLVVMVFRPDRAEWVGLLQRSIRVRFLAAFLYSAVVPLVILGLTAQSYLAERESVLTGELHSKTERAIMTFDRQFATFLNDLKRKLFLYYVRNEHPSGDGYREFQDRYAALRGQYGFDSCLVFDSQGRPVFTDQNPDAPTFLGEMTTMVGRMANHFFRQIRREDEMAATATAAASLPGDTLSEDLLEANLKINFLFFTALEMDYVQTFVFSLPLGDRDDRITHVAFLFWNRQQLELQYIRRHLPFLNRRMGQGEFLAWAPSSPGMVWPGDFPRRALVGPLMAKVTANSRSFRTRIGPPSSPLLLTGIRGTTIHHFSFLGLVGVEEIRQQLADIRWRLGFLSLVVIGSCVVLATALTRLFLDPIRQLGIGVEAIASRNFDLRIAVQGADELGNLATVFNETLEGLNDLEVARVLQENLFPRSSLRHGPWDVYGSCQAASQVGGDYFDYLPLDARYLLIIIGDVSGHGVGAALVVGMVKGLLSHPATPRAPADMLACLNKVLFSILKRKKTMSCELALLDGEHPGVALANAGQTYPLLVRQGKADFLEVQGYPLGSTKNWKASTVTVPLLTNDVLVFYTDGLVEAQDRHGEQVGYDRFREAIPPLIGADALTTERNLRAWHRGVSPTFPPIDDSTAIIVHHRAVEGSPT